MHAGGACGGSMGVPLGSRGVYGAEGDAREMPRKVPRERCVGRAPA